MLDHLYMHHQLCGKGAGSGKCSRAERSGIEPPAGTLLHLDEDPVVGGHADMLLRSGRYGRDDVKQLG